MIFLAPSHECPAVELCFKAPGWFLVDERATPLCGDFCNTTRFVRVKRMESFRKKANARRRRRVLWDFCIRNESCEVNNRGTSQECSPFGWITSSVAKASKHLGVSWLAVDNEKQSSALSRSENSGILLQTHHSTLMWTVLGVSRRLCPWRKTSLFVSRFVNKFSWKIYSACIQNGRERIIERTRVNGFAQNEAARVTIKRSCCWKLSFRRNRQQRFHFAKCHERARPKHAKPRDARQKFIKLLPRQSKASKGGKNYSCAFLICDSRKNKHKRLVSWKIMAGYVDVGCELTLDDAFRGCKHSKRAAKPVHIDAHSEKPFRVQECER